MSVEAPDISACIFFHIEYHSLPPHGRNRNDNEKMLHVRPFDIFLRLSTEETEVFAAKQAEVWQKVKRLIHFFCQSKRNMVCVCVAKPNKEATGWRLARSGATLDLSESEDLGKTSSGSAEASRGEIRSEEEAIFHSQTDGALYFSIYFFSPSGSEPRLKSQPVLIMLKQMVQSIAGTCF